MLHMAPFLTGLMAVAIVAAATARLCNNGPLARTMLAIFINWIAEFLFKHFTGIHDPWQFNIVNDSISAAIILSRPASRWQAMIGVAYCIQIAMHGGYGARELISGIASWGKYNDALTTVAWLQLLLVGVWSGGVWGNRLVRHRISDRRSRLAEPRGGGMAHPGS